MCIQNSSAEFVSLLEILQQAYLNLSLKLWKCIVLVCSLVNILYQFIAQTILLFWFHSC